MKIFIITSIFILSMASNVYAFNSTSFFIQGNTYRYYAFAEENPHFSHHEVVLYTNIGLDHNFYENISYVDNPYDLHILVNKFFRLNSGFSPGDLVGIGGGHYLRQPAAAAFLALERDMYNLGLPVFVRSSYRSYDLQTYIYNRNVANMGQATADLWSARPGHSEHQTGLAVDIIQPGHIGSLGAANFENTYQYHWLLNNAHYYGFILRYPSNYTHITGYEYEPWHWRYLGVDLATYIHNNNIPTLEHYMATRPTQPILLALDGGPVLDIPPPPEPPLTLVGYEDLGQILSLEDTYIIIEESNGPSAVAYMMAAAGALIIVALAIRRRIIRNNRRRRGKRGSRLPR